MVYSTWENEGQLATEKILTMVTRVYLILCVPAAVGLCVLAAPFVALLTTPDYYEGSNIVFFVVFSSFFWGLSQIAMHGIAIKKKARRLAANQIIAAGTHIGLQLLFVPRYGYIAAAISTLIGYTLLMVLQTIASSPYLTWRFPFHTLRNVIAASSVMGLATWWIYGLSGSRINGSPIFLFLSIIIAVPIYFICLWGIGEVKIEEKNNIRQLFSKVIIRF
jgi:O-antigen/teichoic acid export membrane protein